MADLAEACGELARWLPAAQALTAIPDADGSTGRAQPSSRPPWNAPAAAALYDALEGTRQIEAAWRSEAARRPVPPLPVSAMGMVLASLQRLADSVPQASRRDAAARMGRWVTAILQLAAVDEAERPQRVDAACPYCGFAMLRLYPRAMRVTCLRAGACADSDGNHPVGHVTRGRVSGDTEVAWNDGLVT